MKYEVKPVKLPASAEKDCSYTKDIPYGVERWGGGERERGREGENTTR